MRVAFIADGGDEWLTVFADQADGVFKENNILVGTGNASRTGVEQAGVSLLAGQRCACAGGARASTVSFARPAALCLAISSGL